MSLFRIFLLSIISIIVARFARNYFRGGRIDSDLVDSDLTGKVILVTGASSGLGKGIGKVLTAMGSTVVFCYRTEGKVELLRKEIKEYCEERNIDSPDYDFLRVDLSSFSSVKKFLEEFKRRYGRLDVILCNAGVSGIGSDYSSTEDGLEYIFQTNFLSHFLIISDLKDMILEYDSKVLLMSSRAHRYLIRRKDFDDYTINNTLLPILGRYSRSKLSQIILARELHERWNMESYSLHPGLVYTPGFTEGMPFGWLFGPLTKYSVAKTVNDGIQTALYLILSEEEEVEESEHRYYSDCAAREPSKLARSRELADHLWNSSLDILEQKGLLKSQEN